MGLTNKPSDDSKAMTDEYIKGASIADLAVKYNHSEQEVLESVTREPAEEPVVTQAAEDSKPSETKKDK